MKKKALTLEELKHRKPMKPGYADGLCGAVLPSYQERQKLAVKRKAGQPKDEENQELGSRLVTGLLTRITVR